MALSIKLMAAVVLLLGLGLQPGLASNDCSAYLLRLARQFKTNSSAAMEELAPYLMLSGKAPMDLGFMQACASLEDASFSTLELRAGLNFTEENNVSMTLYQGLCFTNECPAGWLNQQKEEIIDLLEKANVTFPPDSDITFVDPVRSSQGSLLPLVVLIVLLTFGLVVGGAYSVERWVKLCAVPAREGDQFIQMDLPAQSGGLLRLVSFQRKIEDLFEEQSSQVPTEVGYITLAAMPMLVLGQEFLWRNHFSQNLLNGEQWYPSLISFITFLCFYIPDLLLFLSAVHLTKPKTRLSYVVPLYVIALLFLLAVKEMRLGQRPLWYAYNEMECSWLNELLLIGGDCPWLGFYPRTQIVGILLSCLVLTVAQRNYRLAIGILTISLAGSFAGMLITERGMPHSFISMQNPQLFKYYSSTAGHLFFFVLGLNLSMAKNHFPRYVDKIVCNPIFRIGGLVLFLGACTLVGLVPWRWKGAYGFQFTVSRIGFVIMSLPLVGRSFRTSTSKLKTKVHKWASLVYPSLLVSSAILPLTALAVGGLSYVSTKTLLELMLGELPLCFILGLAVQLLVDFRLAMPEEY